MSSMPGGVPPMFSGGAGRIPQGCDNGCVNCCPRLKCQSFLDTTAKRRGRRQHTQIVGSTRNFFDLGKEVQPGHGSVMARNEAIARLLGGC